PDGQHCYRVVAMDQAGNLSPPSNQLCAALDNRAPQATIVSPANGSRFEFPVHVAAYTPDLDVASVQFEIKPHASASWTAVGGPDTSVPYETTLDIAGLVFGQQYDLRAVATDQGGRTDPAPAAISITYGDATPPKTPAGLATHVDGQDVTLSWS